MDRQILHVDMNNFFASVECMLDMHLRNQCIAVCGSVENRHGIVLAKNERAKAFGVKTAEPIWQAKQKCANLTIVAPHYESYLKYSRLARRIYERYTDRIEPFGLDECWLDVSGHPKMNGEAIANEIRETVKFELGLTVSCGVSFNKVFAKLGSDMKKPDATTIISRESFREKIWKLPASDMIGIGRNTQKILSNHGIATIGDLAKSDPVFLKPKLKSRAEQLHAFANGEDVSIVLHKDFETPAKSVSHGITTLRDLENDAEVWNVLLALTQNIGRKLKIYGKKASGVSVNIRDNTLHHKQWQCLLPKPSQSATYLAQEAYALFRRSYQWKLPLRSVTVSALNLVEERTPYQLDFFVNTEKEERLSRLDHCVFKLRERFGQNSIRNACLFTDIKMNHTSKEQVNLPTSFPTRSGEK